MRTIDLSGPDGNVFVIAGLAQAWNRQLGKPYNKRDDLLVATTTRLEGKPGDYEDALDTFDGWFKGIVTYDFINDPRDPSTRTEEDDWYD